MRTIKRKVIRYIYQHGFPTNPIFLFFALALCFLMGGFASFLSSEKLNTMMFQSLLKQAGFNMTKKEAPFIVTGGSIQEGIDFSIPYQKVEPNGTISREGVFAGKIWPQKNLIEGETREIRSIYPEGGKRNVRIEKGGMAQIKTMQ